MSKVHKSWHWLTFTSCRVPFPIWFIFILIAGYGFLCLSPFVLLLDFFVNRGMSSGILGIIMYLLLVAFAHIFEGEEVL